MIFSTISHETTHCCGTKQILRCTTRNTTYYIMTCRFCVKRNATLCNATQHNTINHRRDAGKCLWTLARTDRREWRIARHRIDSNARKREDDYVWTAGNGRKREKRNLSTGTGGRRRRRRCSGKRRQRWCRVSRDVATIPYLQCTVPERANGKKQQKPNKRNEIPFRTRF